jgi:hypothetical protein
MPAKSANVGGDNPEFILREFAGMNCIAAREDIEDTELSWCENAIPVAPGALYPVDGPSAALVTIASESGPPSYATNWSAGGSDFCFAVWQGSGNGWIINLGTFTNQIIITGSLTSGETFAVQYSNQGLLIIDPAGYWDYGLTAPNTLTPQNGSLANATLTTTTGTPVTMGINLRQEFTPSTGSGGSVQADYQVSRVVVNAAGTGYAVGDSITLTDGSPITPAQIIVATVGGSGNITGITLAAGGEYPGPTSSTFVQTGPSGNVTATTGSGTGATFTGEMQSYQVTVLSRGHGYPTTTTGVDQYISAGPVYVTVSTYTVTSSGVIGGTSIAVYAGRVWIGSGRTVYFTDINSYNSFGGVGGSFFIPDTYLHDNITALFAANNYLYIFGDTSIDALSNVTVSAGVTFFSRINVTGSVGTSVPTSIFAYYRAIVFYHSSGFYLLAGATPEKISEKVSGLIQNIQPSISLGEVIPRVYGCQVQVQGELCVAMLFNLFDIFSTAPAGPITRTVMALFFRGRWWVASMSLTGTSNQMQAMVSIPSAGTPTLFVWIGNQIFQPFYAASVNNAPWLIRTKLYDGGAPMREKQGINAAFGANYLGQSANTGVQIQVDTEETAAIATTNLPGPPTGIPGPYFLGICPANAGGTQYLGLTVSSPAQNNLTQIRLLALRGKTERDKLQ